LAKVHHELRAAGIDYLVQAVAQLRRAGDINLPTNLDDGGALRDGDMQVKQA